MSTRAFTRDDLLRWQEISDRNRPQTPTHAQCIIAPAVDSFAIMAMRLGLTITLKLDNGETVTARINPAIGQFLFEEIQQAGRECGWLDATGAITFPLTGE